MPDYDRSIHSKADAAAWAKFFVAGYPPGSPAPDEGTMLGWFANAMMAMHDVGPVRRPSLVEAREIAARCWCRPETEKIEMDGKLCEAFAQVLAYGEPDPVPAADRNTALHEYIFTFGLGNPFLGKRYVAIKAPTAEIAREEMVSYFGSKWAFQYESREAAGVLKWGLMELECNRRSLRYG